jgi:hypothetical protein
MTKWKVFGIFIGLLGAFLVYSGVVGYLGHPQPYGSQLAMGILSLLLCLESLAGASREAQSWTALALTSVAGTYGLLELSTEDPNLFWALLAFAGVVAAIFIGISIYRAPGNSWRRRE